MKENTALAETTRLSVALQLEPLFVVLLPLVQVLQFCPISGQ
jgi:hypothetical protein